MEGTTIPGLRVRTIEASEDFRNIPTIGTSGVAIQTLTDGFLYHELMIEVTNLTLAEMTEIRVRANDEIIMRAPGAFFDVLAQREGFTAFATSGILVIPFRRKNMKNRDAEFLTSLNVGVPGENGEAITKIKVEIQCTSVAATPTLSTQCTVSQAIPGGPGLIRRFEELSKNDLVTGGWNTLDALFNQDQKSRERQLLNRLWLNITKTLVTEAEIKKNRVVEDYWEADVQDEYATSEGLVNFADYVIFDPGKEGYGFAPYDLTDADQFSVRLNTTGVMPASMPYYAEFFGSLS